MTDLGKTLDELAQKLAQKLAAQLDTSDVKLPTVISGFEALSAHYIAVSKPVKMPKQPEKPNGHDFGAMQQAIAAAEKQEMN